MSKYSNVSETILTIFQRKYADLRRGIGTMDTNYIIACSCGQRMRVGKAQVGKWGKCAKCGAPLQVTEDLLTPRESRPSVDEQDNTTHVDSSSPPACNARPNIEEPQHVHSFHIPEE